MFFSLYACKEENNEKDNVYYELYPKPIVVKLDTVNGYAVNQLTGDSIKPLVDNNGDTLITGKTIHIEGKLIDPDSVSKPKIVKAGKPTIVPAHTNVHKIPENLTVIPVNEDSLETFTLGVDTSSFVLINSIGDTVPTGIPIHITGKKVPVKQPQPIKVLPFRMKHNALTNIQYLDVEQGLPSTYISSIFKDSKENLWIGTDIGVCRYNGYDFKFFSNNEGFIKSAVWSITEDKNGNLWFCTSGGLIKFDGDSFTHFTEEEGFANNSIYKSIQDKEGNLWFATSQGVAKFDGKNFTFITKKQGLSTQYVSSILEDKNGNLWFGTYFNGIIKYNGEAFINYTKKDGILNDRIRTILEDRHGNLWFGGDKGINKFDGKNFTHLTFEDGIDGNRVTTSFEDKKGNIWFGTYGGGINVFDGEYFTQYSEDHGLSNNFIISSFIDDQGNMWFGTNGSGINTINKELISHFCIDDGLIHNKVRSLYEDNSENIWFGTDIGLSIYNGKNFTNYTSQEDLADKYIEAITEDKAGNIWLCTRGGGLIKFNFKNFECYTDKNGLPGNNIYSIIEDNKSGLWLGTNNGLSNFFENQFTNYSIGNGYFDNIGWKIEKTNQHLWFSSNGFLTKFNEDELVYISEKEGLIENSVITFYKDKSDNLWIGTNSGLCFFNGESFQYLTSKDGLINDQIRSIVADKNENIWISTQNGISVLIRKSDSLISNENIDSDLLKKHTIINIDQNDGLKGADFYWNSVCYDSKGRIWLGTRTNLTMLDLNKFKIPENKPYIQLNSININQNFIDYRQLKQDSLLKNSISKSLTVDYYEKLLFDSIAAFYNYPLNLELPYNLNHLTFNFSAIDWSAPHKLKYQYKLEGLDDSWSNLTDENKADYRNIPYGNYTFKVKAIGAAMKWSDTFEYHFVIHPPWWHTWWARTLYLLALIMLVWSILLLRTAKLKKNQKILEHKVKVRTTEVVEQKKEIEAMNDELHQQNDEILSINEVLNKQKELIEQKNIHITDSINYAQQIQESVFLSDKEINTYFPKSFLINLPKDIVSGDFFWFHQIGNNKIFAVVDCTGHGVPGAIMSMIGNTLLNEIVKDQKITEPSEILNSLHAGVMKALRKSEDTSKADDGMDLVICTYNEETKELLFAGARNYMYVIKGTEPEMIFGDFFSIGEKPYNEDQKLTFTTKKMLIENGTKLYLLTDGYMDQFGGPENKKFNIIPFEKILSKISAQSFRKQKEIIIRSFSEWKASQKQTDDVMIFGVEL